MLGWAGAVAVSIPDLIDRHDVRVEADGTVIHDGPIELLVISVTPWFGRGLRVNPGARLDAGRLTMRIYPDRCPRSCRRRCGGSPRGSPTPGHPRQRVTISSTDGRAVPVQADGDLIGRQDSWTFEIRPAAVQMIGRW